MKNQRRAGAKRVRAAGGVRGFWSRGIRKATNPYWQNQSVSGVPTGFVTEADIIAGFNICERMPRG